MLSVGEGKQVGLFLRRSIEPLTDSLSCPDNVSVALHQSHGEQQDKSSRAIMLQNAEYIK